ncbi:ABC transporter ATP-binding protein [Pseudomonas sp. LRF_L74]|uniref:ABC transporter ATP-binding protein n=1 Tax=Pseudomonas sp. LRF_L74 TaxID=3369422 RepID=UPI003F5E8A25
MKSAKRSVSRFLLSLSLVDGGGRLAAVAVCLVLSTVLLASAPYLIGRIIDQHILLRRIDDLALSCLALLGVYGTAALCAFVQGRFLADVAQGVSGTLRNRLFTHVLQLPLNTVQQRSAGELISRISLDMETLAISMNQSLGQLFSSLILVLVAFAFMLWLSPSMALLSLSCLVLMFATTRYLAKRARRHVANQQESLARLTGELHESIAGLDVIRQFDAQGRFCEAFALANEQLRSDTSRAQVLAGIVGPSMNTCNNLGYVLIAIAGCWMIDAGSATLGLVATFLAYARQLERPVSEFANQFSQIQSAWVGLERAVALLELQREAGTGTGDVSLNGALAFEQVSLAYCPGVDVLKDVSFSIKAGEVIALVGASGAGKSTLFNLILRFIEPQRGEIRLGSEPLVRIAPHALRRFVGVVAQQPYLFAASIEDNIRYGRPDAEANEVRRIAVLLGIDDWVRHLPLGYQTPLQAGGKGLSKGQMQLIAIARALLMQPGILLLDEATSNLDRPGNARVARALTALMEGRTCLVIAHRLDTIRHAERILLLDQGRLVEQGSHSELLARSGAYAGLWQAGEADQARTP